MTEKHRCSTHVYHPREFRPSLCVKPVKVERDGRWYCTIHDPVKVAERDAKKRAEWDKKHEEDRSRFRLQSAAPDLLEACSSVWLLLSDTGDNELRLVADECRAAIAKAKGEANLGDE